ncbi:MAG: hypothetical protein QF486_03105 [Candidatus Woesearchaeota archaeon]|jgi:hypothetical protein|nr:hypothetical protein [Candidatus Woesearchaeota archaeon]MDP7181542.1 hypothetical protein [Candidatus Woesearchaeota archaeon]MDP7198584.1 hypothetical protein [Candidatus Woesearchaeota archaeon]MDP7466674.1 hypothetical protein [Candidatus Woesearchaeota archaeon]MDP7646930.1 hypothetical protein [Candidatus Woesearchaeota archaeon]
MPKLQAFKEHICDTTTQIVVPLPLLAASEKLIADMPDEASIKTRMFAGGLLYFGLGWLYERGRKAGRRMLDITDNSSEWVQGAYDFVYCATAFGVSSPPIYYMMGARDPKEIALGTFGMVVIGSASGPFIGGFTDGFKELMGIGECKRSWFPEIVRRQGAYVKRGIAAGLVTASLLATSFLYHVVDDPVKPNVVQSQPLYAPNNPD